MGRGALAGLIGGALAAIFHWLVTEDWIRAALRIEEAAADHGAHDEMFSRGTQVVGGMVAATIFGVIVGVILSVVCAATWQRLSGRSVFDRSIRLGAAGFVAIALVPALKYPANPPAVGDPDTVGQRTASYLILLACSVAIALLAWELWRRLGDRFADTATRFAAVATAYLTAITIAYLVLPANPDTVEVPANLIWHFRIDSIAGLAITWLATATAFGWLGDRARCRQRAAAAVIAP